MNRRRRPTCLSGAGNPTLGGEEKTRAYLVSCGIIMVSKYVVWYGREREKQNGSSPVERCRSEEVRVVRSGLRWVACLPSGTIVMFWPGLLPRSILGSVALMSLAPVTT